MNQKTIIAILGVTVIILIGTTVYFATINKASQPVAPAPKVVQQPAQPTPGQQQTSQTQPTAPVDETASWQSYSNAKLGFEVKYPSNWKKITPPNDFQGINLLNENGNGVFAVIYYKDINEYLNAGELSFDDLKKDTDYKNVKDISFLGNKAISATFINSFINLSQTVIFVSKGDAIYEIAYDDNDSVDMSRQILSTIKFTN